MDMKRCTQNKLMPVSSLIDNLVESIGKGRKLKTVTVDDVEVMIRLRFPSTDFTDSFARFRADNEKRMG